MPELVALHCIQAAENLLTMTRHDQIMHDLITGCMPPSPPELAGPINDADQRLPLLGPFIPPAYDNIQDFWGALVPPFYTYGGALTTAENGIIASPALIALLLRCLADQPAHRPTLGELQRWVEAADVNPDWNVDDDFYQRAFSQPPEVSCPGADNLEVMYCLRR